MKDHNLFIIVFMISVLMIITMIQAAQLKEIEKKVNYIFVKTMQDSGEKK